MEDLLEDFATATDINSKAKVLLDFVNANFIDIENNNKKISNLFKLYAKYKSETDEEIKKTLFYTFSAALTSLSILRACWMRHIKDETLKLRLNLLYMPFRIHDLHNDFEGLEIFMDTLATLDLFKD